MDFIETEYLPYTSGQFTTDALSITGPSGFSASGVTETAVVTQWNPAADNGYSISAYDVQYRQDGTSSWTSAGPTYGPTMMLVNLTPGTRYDVEVQAVDSAGNTGSWSVATNLFTTASLPAPVPTAPADQAIGQLTLPTFSWDPVSGATGGYNLIVDTSAADLPQDPAGVAGPSAVVSDHVTAASDAPAVSLQVGVTYYWEVQGLGNGGSWGAWSAVQSFTAGTLSAPTLTSPGNQVTALPITPLLSWTAVNGAVDGYNIIVDTSPSDLPTRSSGSAGSTAVFSGQAGAVADRLANPLQPGTTYYWEVQGVASGGIPGNWSSISSFTTTEPAVMVSLDGQTIQPGQGISNPDGTIDFAGVIRGRLSPVETFTIENTGHTILTLGRLSVPQGFTVVAQPPRAIQPGHAASFKIRLKSTQIGTFGGVVSFSNSDSAAGDNPFTFAIAETVVLKPAPVLTVLGLGQTIQPGRFPPRVSNGTDFGTADLGSTPLPVIFTIQNAGNAVLNLGFLRAPPGFAVVTRPPRSLAPGDSATFSIQLNTRRTGTFTGLVTLADNDPRPGQQPFRFIVTGTVVAAADGGG